MTSGTTVEDFNGVEGCDQASSPLLECHGRSQPRLVSFHEPLTTSIHPVPLLSPNEIDELFYNRQDFASFQVHEQRRYEKRMMKRVQQLVEDAMKDQLKAAYARKATLEEIETMMPQTTEEIYSLLGGISALDILKPPIAVRAEPTYLFTSSIETTEGTSSGIDPEEGHQHQDTEDEEEEEDDKKEEENCSQKKEPPDNQLEDISDDALYDILCIEKDENGELTVSGTADGAITLSPKGKEKKNIEESDGNPDETPKRQKRERLRRPDQWAEATDKELYDLLELPKEDVALVKETTNKGSITQRRNLFTRPEKWADATDEELYGMFGLCSDVASHATKTKGNEDATDGSIQEDLK
jgi:hypothetical protein